MKDWVDPIPRRGLVETIACTHKARYGVWPRDFLQIAKRVYGGVIPQRYHDRAAQLEKERPWVPEDDFSW